MSNERSISTNVGTSHQKHTIEMDCGEVIFKNHYYEASKPGSLGGVDAFVKGVGLKKWLSSEDAYTL